MIIVDKNDLELLIPKSDRCCLDDCNIYQLILQHKSTRKLIIYKVRDYAHDNPLYFQFSFYVPDCSEEGEYNVYLTKYSDWSSCEIDLVDVKQTYRETDKDPVNINGAFIVSGNSILMTSNHKSILEDHFGKLSSNGDFFIVNEEAKDQRGTGDLVETIQIIQTDLLKYKVPGSVYGIMPEGLRNNIHIEYKR